MATLLTMFVAMTGGGFVTWGWGRFLRGRFRVKDPALGVSVRRSGAIMAVGGGLLLLLPEVPSHLLFDSPAQTGVAGAFGTFAAWVWRLCVLAGLATVYGSMALMRERVTRPIREAAQRGMATVVSLVPVGAPGEVRRMRRMPHLAAFPRDWASLVAHDQMLTRRLLDYERNLDLAANLPAMRDHSVPATASCVGGDVAVRRAAVVGSGGAGSGGAGHRVREGSRRLLDGPGGGRGPRAAAGDGQRVPRGGDGVGRGRAAAGLRPDQLDHACGTGGGIRRADGAIGASAAGRFC